MVRRISADETDMNGRLDAAELAELNGCTTEAPPQGRTEAQRRASRQNGARSKGPKTAAGKSRSRCNSLRHGLRARTLSPLAIAGSDRRDYQKLLEGLSEQFGQHGQVGRMLSELAALDHVRARRAVEMAEQQVGATAADDLEPFDDEDDLEEQVERLRQLRDLVAGLKVRLAAEQPPALEPGQAAELAEAMTPLLQSDLERLQPPESKLLVTRRGGISLQRLREMYADLDIRALSEHGPEALAGMLEHDQPLPAPLNEWWGEMLPRLSQHLDQQLAVPMQKLRERTRWRMHRRREQAGQLPSLQTLADYERRHRRQLHRTFELLLKLDQHADE